MFPRSAWHILALSLLSLALAAGEAHALTSCNKQAAKLYKWNNFPTGFLTKPSMETCATAAASNDKSSDAAKARAGFISSAALSKAAHVSSTKRLEAMFVRPGGFSIPVWAVLGPFISGKAELDGDPVAAAASNRTLHPQGITEFTRMYAGLRLPSELAASGYATWSSVKASKGTRRGQGQQHAVRTATYQPAGTDFNMLVQQLSSLEVLEFQAWAVAPLTVPAPGRYTVHCAGVHTAYIRSGQPDTDSHEQPSTLYPLVGDIYNSGHVVSSVFLRQGLHEVLLPLRGKGAVSFGCGLRSVSHATHNSPAAIIESVSETKVPDFVQNSRFCGRFVPAVLRNDGGLTVQASGVSSTESFAASGTSADYSIEDRGSGESVFLSISLAEHALVVPGQRSALMFKLSTVQPSGTVSNGARKVYWQAQTTTVSVFIAVTNTAGVHSVVSVSLPLRRRSLQDSFRCTFLANDGSIQGMSIVAPLPVTQSATIPQQFPAFSVRGVSKVLPLSSAVDPFSRSVPILVSLHGTGVSSDSQADAHKRMLHGSSEYTFGVPGYWVLAPERFGAHNWEGLGLHTVWSAVSALGEVTCSLRDRNSSCSMTDGSLFAHSHAVGSALPEFPREGAKGSDACVDAPSEWRAAWHCLPQADIARILWAGHSMGGHGAWHALTHSPGVSIGGAPMAGWIKKEEYGDANTFMKLDASGAAVPMHLRAILQSAAGGQDAAAALPSLGGAALPLHIRVGSNDNTVSPWFSKRMLRLLRLPAVDSDPTTAPNATLELVPGKEHWWWDTKHANDGGVLADDVLRTFYESSRERLSGQAVLRHLSLFAVHWAGDAAARSKQLNSAILKLWPRKLVIFSDSQDDMVGGWGVRILQRQSMLAPGTVSIELSSSTGGQPHLRLSTSNVAKFSLRMHEALWSAGVLFAGGASLDGEMLHSRTAQPDTASHSKVAAAVQATDASPFMELVLENHGSGAAWRIASQAGAHGRTISTMWHRRAVIAVPKAAQQAHDQLQRGQRLGAHEIALARLYTSALYLANQVQMAAAISPLIVLSDSAAPSCDEHKANIVFRQEEAQLCSNASNLNVYVGFEPLLHENVSLGTVRVARGSGASCVQWSAVTEQGWSALQRLMQPTIPPMVRAAGTNYLPACVSVDGRVHALGYGAFLAAGWPETAGA